MISAFHWAAVHKFRVEPCSVEEAESLSLMMLVDNGENFRVSLFLLDNKMWTQNVNILCYQTALYLLEYLHVMWQREKYKIIDPARDNKKRSRGLTNYSADISITGGSVGLDHRHLMTEIMANHNLRPHTCNWMRGPVRMSSEDTHTLTEIIFILLIVRLEGSKESITL